MLSRSAANVVGEVLCIMTAFVVSYSALRFLCCRYATHCLLTACPFSGAFRQLVIKRKRAYD